MTPRFVFHPAVPVIAPAPRPLPANVVRLRPYERPYLVADTPGPDPVRRLVLVSPDDGPRAA